MKNIEDLVAYNKATSKIKIKNIINRKLKDAERALDITLKFYFNK